MHTRFPTDNHGWAELLPARNPCSSLRGDHRFAWVVIGAGLTGLACARRLAALHPGDEIAVLEARQVAQGASGRNSGFAVAVSQFPGELDPVHTLNHQRINRINAAGLDMLRHAVTEGDIDCQWREQGFHHTAADTLSLTECEHFLRYLNAMEIAHTPLDQGELRDRLGTSLYQVGVHVHAGALMQPAALVRGLAATLPPNVTLFEQSPVLEITGGTPVALRLNAGHARADNVILATNYEAAQLGYLRGRILGSSLAGSFTRVLSSDEVSTLGNLKDWGVLSLHGGGATVRLTTDGRISLRNTAEYHGGVLLSDDALATRQVIHRDAFETRFPQLAHVPFEFAWSGVEGISRNSTNFFGKQRDNIYLAGGFNGSGVSRGTAFGTAIAEYASGGHSTLITDCLASPPATWIPPRPFLDIGAWFTVKSRFKGVGLDQ
jgi:glycine/D-amino acid oxidase-like deaminating enzyme